MAKSGSQLNSECNTKRQMVSKSYKLSITTVASINALASHTKMTKGSIIAQAILLLMQQQLEGTANDTSKSNIADRNANQPL